MERIVTDPKVLAGKPVIRGTRIPVHLILNLVANGKTTAQIIEDYPDLTAPDIKAAIDHAARHMRYEETKRSEASLMKL